MPDSEAMKELILAHFAALKDAAYVDGFIPDKQVDDCLVEVGRRLTNVSPFSTDPNAISMAYNAVKHACGPNHPNGAQTLDNLVTHLLAQRRTEECTFNLRCIQYRGEQYRMFRHNLKKESTVNDESAQDIDDLCICMKHASVSPAEFRAENDVIAHLTAYNKGYPDGFRVDKHVHLMITGVCSKMTGLSYFDANRDHAAYELAQAWWAEQKPRGDELMDSLAKHVVRERKYQMYAAVGPTQAQKSIIARNKSLCADPAVKASKTEAVRFKPGHAVMKKEIRKRVPPKAPR